MRTDVDRRAMRLDELQAMDPVDALIAISRKLRYEFVVIVEQPPAMPFFHGLPRLFCIGEGDRAPPRTALSLQPISRTILCYRDTRGVHLRKSYRLSVPENQSSPEQAASAGSVRVIPGQEYLGVSGWCVVKP